MVVDLSTHDLTMMCLRLDLIDFAIRLNQLDLIDLLAQWGTKSVLDCPLTICRVAYQKHKSFDNDDHQKLKQHIECHSNQMTLSLHFE